MFKRITIILMISTGIINHSISNYFEFLHEYFVSICEAELNPKSNKIELSFKFTTHDFEKAVLLESGENLKLGDTKQHQNSDSLIFNYVKNHFSIHSKENIKLNYIGFVSKLDETLFVFIETDKIYQPDNLTINNSLLIEVFDLQQNILHLGINNSKRSIVFDKNTTSYKQ